MVASRDTLLSDVRNAELMGVVGERVDAEVARMEEDMVEGSADKPGGPVVDEFLESIFTR